MFKVGPRVCLSAIRNFKQQISRKYPAYIGNCDAEKKILLFYAQKIKRLGNLLLLTFNTAKLNGLHLPM